MQKISVVMLNYNMPEIIEHNIRVLNTSEVPMDIVVVENGSDEEWMFVPNNEDTHMVYLDYNLRATHGYRMGLAYVKSLEALNDEKYFAYFIMTTTGQLMNDETDPFFLYVTTCKKTRMLLSYSQRTMRSQLAFGNTSATGGLALQGVHG